MISSLANRQVKRIRRLQNDRRYRQRERAFVVEGTRMLSEIKGGILGQETVYYTQEWLNDPAHKTVLDNLDLQGELVTDEVMKAISATETAPGVLAVTAMNPLPLPSEPTMVLIVDTVTTPGNLGSMLRTAAAAAVDAVLLSPGCVDAYNPKVVRGAMGAHFRLPIENLDWPSITSYCDSITICLSRADGNQRYTDFDWCRGSALIIGNEARGAGREAHKAAQDSITIPMARATESLNAAAATAVILFEAFRQRDFREVAGKKSHL